MSEELGVLVVVILKAKNLNDKHSFYKQDVYAKATLHDAVEITSIEKKGGQHPVWDEEKRFTVSKNSAAKYRTLEVSCWAKESKQDDLLGTGKVDISETLRTGEFDDWVKLEIDGVHRGDLYLEMTYYSSASKPEGTNLLRRPSKFIPDERLSRPQDRPQPANHLAPYPNSQSPPHSRTSSSSYGRPSPEARDSPLPPLPDYLKRGSRPVSQGNISPPAGHTQYSPPTNADKPLPGPGLVPVPSMLRPGNPKSSPKPVVQPRRQSPPEHSRPNPYGESSQQSTYAPSTYVRDDNYSASAYSRPPPSDYRTPSVYGQPPSNNPYVNGNASGAPPSFPMTHGGIPPVENNYSQALSYPQQQQPGYPPQSTYPPPQQSYPPQPYPSEQPYIPGHQFGQPSYPQQTFPPPPQPSFSPPPQQPHYQPFQAPSFQGERSQSVRPPWEAAPQQSDLPDPFLIARYTTPLPLPPGSAPSMPSSPPPVAEHRQPRRSDGEELRLAARRLEEEERREMEKKDMELAMRLDRELNLANNGATSPGLAMPQPPGSWN